MNSNTATIPRPNNVAVLTVLRIFSLESHYSYVLEQHRQVGGLAPELPNIANTARIRTRGSLADMKNLNYLALNRTQVSGAEIEHLKGLTKLETLQLRGPTTDAGLEYLKGLTNLQRLWLDNAQITDVGLEHLKGLTNLRELSLGVTPVTDEGVKKLQEVLPNCEMRYALPFPHSRRD